MRKKGENESLVESGLLQAMHALDAQIARELQRTPAETSLQGVQKWEPIGKRVEQVAGAVMNGLAEEEIGLDSLLVLSQALVKSLYLFAEDLGAEGLGKIRTGYCLGAVEAIRTDSQRALDLLRDERSLV